MAAVLLITQGVLVTLWHHDHHRQWHWFEVDWMPLAFGIFGIVTAVLLRVRFRIACTATTLSWAWAVGPSRSIRWDEVLKIQRATRRRRVAGSSWRLLILTDISGRMLRMPLGVLSKPERQLLVREIEACAPKASWTEGPAPLLRWEVGTFGLIPPMLAWFIAFLVAWEVPASDAESIAWYWVTYLILCVAGTWLLAVLARRRGAPGAMRAFLVVTVVATLAVGVLGAWFLAWLFAHLPA